MKESNPVVNCMQSTREINERLARTAELLEQRASSLQSSNNRLSLLLSSIRSERMERERKKKEARDSFDALEAEAIE
jgi:hypothetical protein